MKTSFLKIALIAGFLAFITIFSTSCPGGRNLTVAGDSTDTNPPRHKTISIQPSLRGDSTDTNPPRKYLQPQQNQTKADTIK